MNNWMTDEISPFSIFKDWFELAVSATDFEPTQMTLATVDGDGMPSGRVVLLKRYDERGLCFFTNYESVKSKELVEQGKAALIFHWEKPFHRQVRVRGFIEKTSREESEEYYNTRSRGSQIGAWASSQSRPIESRDQLMNKVKEFEDKFKGKDVPCPPHWGGFRLKPVSYEFWQSQDYRLHDRRKFDLQADGSWKSQRLAP